MNIDKVVSTHQCMYVFTSGQQMCADLLTINEFYTIAECSAIYAN